MGEALITRRGGGGLPSMFIEADTKSFASNLATVTFDVSKLNLAANTATPITFVVAVFGDLVYDATSMSAATGRTSAISYLSFIWKGTTGSQSTKTTGNGGANVIYYTNSGNYEQYSLSQSGTYSVSLSSDYNTLTVSVPIAVMSSGVVVSFAEDNLYALLTHTLHN